MASRLQDVILRGTAALKPLATAVAPGTLYYSTDTQVTERSNGTIWESYSDAGGGGSGITQLTGDVTAGPGTGSQVATLANTTVVAGSYTSTNLTVDAKGRITAAASSTGTLPSLHASTHGLGGSDAVTVAESQVTNLTTDLAAKASTTDPRFTDARTPTAHATSHSSGGSDAVDVKNLAGYPGGTSTFLRADNTFATPAAGVPAAHHLTHESGGTDEIVNINANNLTSGTVPAARLTAANLPAHASSHSNASSDPITITNLAGYPGGGTTFLRDDHTFAAPTAAVRTGTITMITDGGTSAITAGLKGYLEIPFICTIVGWTLLADVSGSIVIDVWKDTYANYPPTVSDTITASAKPTITTAVKNQSSTLTGWTTSIAAGDIIGFNVDSVTTIKKITLSIKIQA